MLCAIYPFISSVPYGLWNAQPQEYLTSLLNQNRPNHNTVVAFLLLLLLHTNRTHEIRRLISRIYVRLWSCQTQPRDVKPIPCMLHEVKEHECDVCNGQTTDSVTDRRPWHRYGQTTLTWAWVTDVAKRDGRGTAIAVVCRNTTMIRCFAHTLVSYGHVISSDLNYCCYHCGN